MRRLFVVLLIFIFVQTQAQASVVGSAAKMASAVSGAIQQKLVRAGFAANDPRFGATVAAASVSLNDAVTVASSTAGLGMAVAGVAGLPAWATIAVGLGIAAIAFGAYTLLTGNNASTIGITAPASDPVQSLVPVSTETGYDVICLPGVTNCVPSTATFPSDVPYRYRTSYDNVIHAVRNYGDLKALITSNDLYNCTGCTLSNFLQTNNGLGQIGYTYDLCAPSGFPPPNECLGVSSGSNHKTVYTTANTAYVPQPLSPTTTAQSLDAVVASLPDSALTTPLSAQTVAAIADKAFQNAAAKPGYSGLPYSMTDPVTSADVSAWQAQNPMTNQLPNAADLLNPMTQPVTLPAPTTTPTTTTTTTPTTTTTTVDLGPNPGIAAPTLESTPTAAQILAPLLNLMPDLKSFVVPSHTSTCPRPTASVWGQTLTLSGHCDLLDAPAVHDTLYAVMFVVWTMVGLFIVLKA